jgi:hypothetical protein
MEKTFFEIVNEQESFASFVSKETVRPHRNKGNLPPDGQEVPFLSSFLPEMTQAIKRHLASVINFSYLSLEKGIDAQFRTESHERITDLIKGIDRLLNALLNFTNVNTPMIRKNTVRVILEEILEANERQLQEKRIEIFKKFEEDLPEILMHDEQVTFILDAVFQYATLCTPMNGTIALLVKPSEPQRAAPSDEVANENNGRYLEVAIGFPHRDEVPDESAEKDETADLILQLAKEILQRNHGDVRHNVAENNDLSLVTLRFPIERRKIVYYGSVNL